MKKTFGSRGRLRLDDTPDATIALMKSRRRHSTADLRDRCVQKKRLLRKMSSTGFPLSSPTFNVEFAFQSDFCGAKKTLVRVFVLAIAISSQH